MDSKRWQSAPTKQARHVVIDSTGLKVFGAGEWYVRKHNMGRGRRGTWRKLHLGVDEETKEIVAVDLTASNIHDSSKLPVILDPVMGKVAQMSGDRAYDTGRCYQVILARQGRARRGAASHQERGALPMADFERGYSPEPGRERSFPFQDFGWYATDVTKV